MGSVVEAPYHRLSGKEQATQSASTAAQAVSTAQSALEMTSQGADTAGADAGEDDAAEAPEEAAVPSEEAQDASASPDADAGDQQAAKAVVAHALKDMLGGQQGAALALNAGGGPKLPKLSGLAQTAAPGGAGGDVRGNRGGADGMARKADVSSEITRGSAEHDAVMGRPEVLVTVPSGKRPGDFFSADVAGRGSMLIEVPEGVRGGDDLQLLQMPTDDGEALEWVKYAPGSARAAVSRAGPDEAVMDRNAAARDSIRSAWSLGDRAPRSYFH